MPRKEGITNWLAKRRPQLSEEAARKRLAWALKHKDWTWDEWSKVIFSDECSLERGVGARRLWVFRTADEKWNKEMICPYPKGKDISVMIWGSIHNKGRSDVVIMNRDPDAKKSGYTANSYLEILKFQPLEKRTRQIARQIASRPRRGHSPIGSIAPSTGPGPMQPPIVDFLAAPSLLRHAQVT
jgi:hypothetical protein